MQTRVEKIKQLLKDTEIEYHNHSTERKGLVVHELVEKNKTLFITILTLKHVIRILEGKYEL